VAIDQKHAPASGPVVVTGFEPFGGRSRNRSWEAVRRMSGELPCETWRLPVDYVRLRSEIAAICERQPSVVLLVGECPARSLAVEQIALNVVDTDRPDNSRQTPSHETLLAGAPLALRAAWDARAVAARIEAAGIPATPSFHAGTYACNAALFLALASFGENARVGFLHVPYWPRPRGIRLDALGQAIRICVEALSVSSRNRPLRGRQSFAGRRGRVR
jgi:pyroglutamyl-peptidase